MAENILKLTENGLCRPGSSKKRFKNEKSVAKIN